MPSMFDIAGIPRDPDTGRFVSPDRRPQPKRESRPQPKPEVRPEPQPLMQQKPDPQAQPEARPMPQASSDGNPLLRSFIDRFPDSDPARASIPEIGASSEPRKPQNAQTEETQDTHTGAQSASAPMQGSSGGIAPKWLGIGAGALIGILALVSIGRFRPTIGQSGSGGSTVPTVNTSSISGEVII